MRTAIVERERLGELYWRGKGEDSYCEEGKVMTAIVERES